jgi:peptide deformylase
MTIRTIVRYPDPRLALPAQPVTMFDGALRAAAAAGAEFFIIDTSGIGVRSSKAAAPLEIQHQSIFFRSGHADHQAAPPFRG